jgi:nitrate reductase assembly molybdenum cofactor insertion protein NarJ
LQRCLLEYPSPALRERVPKAEALRRVRVKPSR